jgi:hypothetical protein
MAGRRRILVIVVILVCAVLAFSLWKGIQQIQQTHVGFRTSPGIILGSKQTGPYSPVGWLMPGDTRVATSYVANQTFDRNYMNAYVTVLSSSTYQLQHGTTISFDLYINGQLMGTRTCLTDNISGSGGWAGYGATSNASYSLNTYTCGVSLFRTPFPAGSTLTVTVWSNHPVWMQVDSSPTTTSYETFNVASSAQPPTIDPTSGSVAPRTITVDAYSD